MGEVTDRIDKKLNFALNETPHVPVPLKVHYADCLIQYILYIYTEITLPFKSSGTV